MSNGIVVKEASQPVVIVKNVVRQQEKLSTGESIKIKCEESEREHVPPMSFRERNGIGFRWNGRLLNGSSNSIFSGQKDI